MGAAHMPSRMHDPQTSTHATRVIDAGRIPRRERRRIVVRAMRLALGERRTKRAFFFTSVSLLVGFTVARGLGVLLCGLFGGSLFAVVLVLRMQRHLRAGEASYFEARSTEGD